MIWVHHPKKHISYRIWIVFGTPTNQFRFGTAWFAPWPEAGWEHLWQGSHLGIFAANGRMGTVCVYENGTPNCPNSWQFWGSPWPVDLAWFRGLFSRSPVFEPQFPRLVFPFCQRMSKERWHGKISHSMKPQFHERPRMFHLIFFQSGCFTTCFLSFDLGYPNMAIGERCSRNHGDLHNFEPALLFGLLPPATSEVRDHVMIEAVI